MMRYHHRFLPQVTQKTTVNDPDWHPEEGVIGDDDVPLHVVTLSVMV